MREKPRRKFETWFMDVTKQGLGAVYAHLLNMLVAAIIASYHRSGNDGKLDDQCAWYAINYLVDTTFGLVLALMFLKILDYLANTKKLGKFKKLRSLLWTAKMDTLERSGSGMDCRNDASKDCDSVFHVNIFPGFLNVIYFWIIDSYIKAQDTHAHAHESDSEEEQMKTEVLVKENDVEQSDPPLFPVPIGGTQTPVFDTNTRIV